MKKGDFVEIEFVGRLSNTGEVFDLNSEEEAKKEGIYNPKHKYKPSLVVIGSGMSVQGLEKQLESMKVDEEKEFLLKPDEAFGKKDMKLIRIVSISKFTKEKINPAPGIMVDIDGMQAKVLSVAGGRVRIDFNHPLSGRELKYKVKVVRDVTDTLEKARLLLSFYGINSEASREGDTLNLQSEKPLNEFIKRFAGEKVMELVPEIKNVIFSSKEEKKAEERPQENQGGEESKKA